MQLHRGIFLGARRLVLISKRGKLNFYKGRGCKPTGLPTNKGGYIIHGSRVPEIIAPNLARFNLRPYVSYRAPNVVSKIITADDLLLLQTNQNKM
jgi:large subunit ribosomal protein L41